MTKTLIIHRHGEYKENLDPILKLNRLSVAENFLQGKELANKRVAFYSSPIERAINTINIKVLASGHKTYEVNIVDGFHEDNIIFDGMKDVEWDNDIDIINIASHLPTIADAFNLETVPVNSFVKIQADSWEEVRKILYNKEIKHEVISLQKDRIELLNSLQDYVFGNCLEEIIENLDKAKI